MRESQDKFKDFLENIQINSSKIGTAVLRKYLIKRKPDMEEDHPLLLNPIPIKKMAAFDSPTNHNSPPKMTHVKIMITISCYA